MNELPWLLQAQQASPRSVSAEDLELFGKEAAAAWRDCRYKTIGEAVVETVKSAALSPQQVKRVVEFANTNAFLSDFRSKTAAGGHGYVDFGPGVLADPGQVLQDLNDGGGGAPEADLRDYAAPPEKTAGDLTLEQIFGDLPEHEVLPDASHQVGIVQEKLSAARDLAVRDLSHFEVLYDDVARELVSQVKMAMREHGVSAGCIVQAWSSVGVPAGVVKLAFQELTQRGRIPAPELEQSLQKVGSARVVNPAHPLVAGVQDYALVLDKLAELHRDIDVLTDGLQAWAEVRRTHGDEALAKLAGTEKALWPKLVEYAGKAAGPAEKGMHAVVRTLVGKSHADRIAPAIGKAVEKSPHVLGGTALGLGGYQAYDAATSNPYVQYGMSFVPGTPQERMRSEMRKAQGAQTAYNMGIPYIP